MTVPYTEPEHLTALAICARAHSRNDAVLLLDACGLLRPGLRVPHRRCYRCGYLLTAYGHKVLCQPENH